MSGTEGSLVAGRRALDGDTTVERAAFSPDGSLLILALRGKEKRRLAFTVPALRPAAVPGSDAACGLDRLDLRALHAPGKRRNNKLLVVPRAPGASEVHTFRLHGGYVLEHVDATPDLRLAAAVCEWHGRASPEPAVWLVNVPEGSPRAPLVLKAERIRCLALHPAGSLLALITAGSIVLLDAAAVLRAEAIHQRSLDALPKHRLADLQAARVAGLGYGDFFVLYSSFHPAVCDLEERPAGRGGQPQSQAELQAQFAAAARRGTGLSLPLGLFRKSGQLWPDVLSVGGRRLLSGRAVQFLEASGFTGWRATPQPIAEPGVPHQYSRLEATAPPLPRLRETQFADPAEYSPSRWLFDLAAWRGDDVAAIEGGLLVVTRRVIDAMQEADLRGWAARDLLESGERIEGALPADLTPSRGAARRPKSRPASVELPTAAVLAAAARRAGLGRVAHEIAAAARPAWHLSTRPVSQDDVPPGGSCLGGLPDLPAGTPWPRREQGLLSFLGQLQVADIAAIDSDKLLPAAGHFSFFLDENDCNEGAAHVLFTPAGARLERLTSPGGKLKQYLPCAVDLEAFASFPDSDSPVVAAWSLSDDEKDAYHDLCVSGVDSDRHHQVFGHPTGIGNDVFSAASQEGKLWPLAESRLLLQLDCDDDLGTEWGDCGHVYFVLPAEALRALQLDRTVFEFQCH